MTYIDIVISEQTRTTYRITEQTLNEFPGIQQLVHDPSAVEDSGELTSVLEALEQLPQVIGQYDVLDRDITVTRATDSSTND